MNKNNIIEELNDIISSLEQIVKEAELEEILNEVEEESSLEFTQEINSAVRYLQSAVEKLRKNSK